MRVDVTPRQAEIIPGQQLFLTVSITNTSTVIGGYTLRVLGADPGWVVMDSEQISLFPDEARVLLVTVTPPKGIPAGVRRIAVQVRELTPPADSSITEIDLTVPSARSMQIRVDPVAVTGGKRGTFSVIAENTGNTTIAGRFAGDDAEKKVEFAFDPEIVTLAPGEHAVVDMRAKAKRHFTGSPAVRLLGLYLDETPAEAFFTDPDGTVTAARGEEAAVANATFIQKSVLSRGALSLVGLLVAVTVFALVITLALGRLVGQTTADRNLALQVAAAAQNGNAGTGTSSMAGTVKQLTNGKPLGAVSVALFDAADTTKPLVTTATGPDGGFKFNQLAAGKYKISFKRAGYVPLWYPAATTDADATAIELKTGNLNGLNVVLGGLPATISGTVIGDDVSASTLYLEAVPGRANTGTTQTNARSTAQLPAAAGGGTTPGANPLAAGNAIVQKVPVGADGTFTLTNVPSPNVYQLVVVKTGYATTTQALDVAGGENRTGVELTLRKGDGSIRGTISDPSGPRGEATITATSGQTSVTTVSLTDAANRGKFSLLGLPTPGTFTLTVTLADHASQTLTLTLASGESLKGVAITLNTSSGALDGIVKVLHQATPTSAVTAVPEGGVVVTATDGLLTVQSETDSRTQVGHWHIGGLPIPGTYTLTFARSDLTSQTVSVSLDANGKVPAATGGTTVDAAGQLQVSMQPSTTTLSGTVTRSCGIVKGCKPTPLGEATVTLNSGSKSYTVTSASTPASERGQYRIDNLPPGTYTLTVSLGSGTSPYSRVINLVAGVPSSQQVTLNSPASVSGTLKTEGTADSPSAPLTNWTIFLYTAEQYPSIVTTQTLTDANDGTFTIKNLNAGDYLIAIGPTSDAGGAVMTVQFTLQTGAHKNLGTITVPQ